MSGPESKLWSWMRQGLRPLGLPHDVHRIETGTESGYPDVEGCIDRACFLLELKVARSIRKGDGSFSLDHYHAKQAYTLWRRWQAGGRSWLLVRYPGSEQTGRHFLVPGREALVVHDSRMKLQLGFMRSVSWPGLEDGSAKAESLWRAISGPIVRGEEAHDH